MDNFQKWQCAFIISCIFSLFCWQLPPFSIILPGLLLCVWLIFRQKVILAATLFGFCWFFLHAHWQINWHLPLSLVKQPVVLVGVVDDIPSLHHKNLRFNLSLQGLNDKKVEFWQPVKIRLTWHNAKQKLSVGDKVRLHAKLKPPYGYTNDGGFSYQKWLLLSGIRATGYLLNNKPIEFIESGNSQRQHIYNLVKQSTETLSYQGLLLALTVGDKQSISKSQWQAIQGAGINHLLAISGLHIGIVFILGSLIAKFALKSISFVFGRHINAPKWAIVFGLLAACGYAYLAGFAVPTVRALLMLTFLSLALLIQTNLDSKSIVLNALFFILLVNPLTILEAGLWLSFAAVVIILLVFWWLPLVTRNRYKQYLESGLKVQLALFLLMIPLTMVLFNGFSVSGAVVNLFAVPWVSFVTVPLALLGVCSQWLFGHDEWLFWLANGSIDGLFQLIHWMQGHKGWLSFAMIPWFYWLFGIAFCLSLFVPMRLFNRMIAVLLLSPVVMFASAEDKRFKVNILDVGQGLSVAIVQDAQLLLYDLGPVYKSGFNTAEQVVMPFIVHHGFSEIDKLILSHADSDHAGHWQYIVQELEVNNITAPKGLINGAEQCIASKQQWHGLSLEILWPIPNQATAPNKNDSSCVIRVSNGVHSILLTGDISKRVERRLVSRYGHKLRSDILIAPHHGSNSSSSIGFIKAVNPQYVVYATGYLNHYKFPRESVVKRYTMRGVKQLNTATTGQITFDLNEQTINVNTARENQYRQWYYNQ